MKLALLPCMFALILGGSPAISVGDDFGSICIAPNSPSNEGSRALGNPRGGARSFDYEIQIDEHPKVRVSPVDSIGVTGLAYEGKHLVRVFRGGLLVESFRFQFSRYQSHDLCLRFGPLYETWMLDDKRRGDFCKCEPG